MHTDIDPVGEVFFALCKEVDSPIALSAWLRYKSSHTALVELDIRPSDYLDVDLFEKDYLVVNYLSKWKGLKTGVDLRKEALSRFTQAELNCAATNLRFRDYSNSVASQPPWLAAVLHGAQLKIAKLLGDVDVARVQEGWGWGPGSVVGIPRRRAFVDTKMCELPITVTRQCLALFKRVIEQDLHWSEVILGIQPSGRYSLLTEGVFDLVEGAHVTTVPKNAKTDRVIAVEPRANGFLQKGIGLWIRRKLRTVGVNLDDQGVNQKRARRAYFDSLATLDLKAASDTVSREVVYSLLPPEWAFELDRLRSPKALVDGSWLELEKFSSMGNGFTFELESLLFWALASSVATSATREEVSVYGDDIIVHQADTSRLIQVLSFCGFNLNMEKSFIDGEFYESCGEHYFKGVLVTPVYQKETVDSPEEAIHCGNRLMRWSCRRGMLRSMLRSAWLSIRRFGGYSSLTIPLGEKGDDAWLVPVSDFSFRERDFETAGRFCTSTTSSFETVVVVRAPELIETLSHGLSCAVYRRQPTPIPGVERALFAHTLRQGVVTASPFGGNVEIPPDEHSKFVVVRRRVIPGEEFYYIWT